MAPTWVLPTVVFASFIISLINQVVYYKLTDQEFIKSRKSKIKSLQKKLLNANASEAKKINEEAMRINNELMSHTMKPTMYTFIPLLIVFWLFKSLFSPYGDLITLPVSLPLFGNAISWLGTYILSSFFFSLTLKPIIIKVGDKYGKLKK